MKIESTIVVNRPVQEVFDTWCDLEKSPEWADPVIERRKITDGPLAVGTQFHAKDRWPMRTVEFTVEITAYQPNEFVAASWSEPMEGGWEARFEEAPEGTQLSFTADAKMKGLLALLEPLMTGWARKQNDKFMGKFKNYVEGARA